VPVRAKVDITLIEYGTGSLPLQNPTSGGGPIERVWRVTAGDRLDTIAAEVYKDATKWRLIARHNGIVNPFALRAGLELGIPPVE
jgi:nucleoid-associated protein YgaU